MKKLLICLGLLLFAAPSFAWTLNWQASTGAEGYVLYFRPIDATAWGLQDVGNVTTFDLNSLSLTEGQRYEFKLQAYAGNPKSYSGDSDILRWTYPVASSIINIPAAPSQIIINFQAVP